ncbi:MAG TPA: DUF4249 family protein [Gemmatimonadales bacterium]|nr:DUF4249 family protein [Gemmatimonadales bacterium]
MVRREVFAIALVLAFGCKLTEVTQAPPGTPAIVVQSILSTAESTQTVLVQQSQEGDTTSGVSGATVALTDLDPRGCSTPTVILREVPLAPGVIPGTYQGRFCSLAAGDRVTLHVTTPTGQVVTGQTTIPGITSPLIEAGAMTAGLPPASLTLDRITDSLSVTAQPVRARALFVEAVRTTAGEDPSLQVATDTTTVRLPGNLIDPTGDGRVIFRAGAYYDLTAAGMDTNYYDFFRSATNPLTGRGFINHLNGAVGVFGSVAPLGYELRVVAPQTDPREGIYHLTGHVAGIAVDVTWNAYREPLVSGATFDQGDAFCAFVDGQWVGGPIRTSANGSFPDSTWVGRMFGPTHTDAANPTYVLTGIRAAKGVPFKLTVRPVVGTRVDTVSAVQVSGP